MTALYFTDSQGRENFLARLIYEHTGKNYPVLRTPEGKPYIEGDAVFFSLSHSGGLCAIAVSNTKVGTDTELVRERNYSAVLSSFPAEERAEIKNSRDFFAHWTAREAYVKYCGGKIWNEAKILSFVGGRLYRRGIPLPQHISFCFERGAVTAVCSDFDGFEIKTLQ